MTFIILTLGCKLNFTESSDIAHRLCNLGLIRIYNNDHPDFSIIHSCAVTHEAERKTLQLIHRTRREHPNTTLILIGCFAQKLIKNNTAIPITIFNEVDYILSQNEKLNLPQQIFNIAHRKFGVCQISKQTDLFDTYVGASSYNDRTRCFLKIQDGCDYHCSYCIIPQLRGHSRNEPATKIVNRASNILQSGFKEIVLTGVNIGDFGHSTNERFIDLLKALDELSDTIPYRIRISSCEPNLLNLEIIDFVANSKHFAPHFHIPLQSGSDDMLKIMGRRYNLKDFMFKLEYIKQCLPNAFIGLDCMVGVLGETQELFNDYLAFLSSIPFSQLHVFSFSERDNTRILSMNLPKVPIEEIHHRNAILRTISRRHLKDFYLNQIGKETTVLWEKGNDNNKCIYGFTENYIKLTQQYDETKVNTFENVILDKKNMALDFSIT